jgi:hypothetical protein
MKVSRYLGSIAKSLFYREMAIRNEYTDSFDIGDPNWENLQDYEKEEYYRQAHNIIKTAADHLFNTQL